MTVITVISVGLGMFSTIYNILRSKKTDDKSAANEMTTLVIKLEGIQQSLVEIKTEMRQEINMVRTETTANTGNIIRIEESLKSAWNAINKLQDRGMDDGK